MARKQLGVAPSPNSTDVATTAYADALAGGGSLANGGAVTAGSYFDAAPDTFYTVDANSALTTVRLPLAPAQGSQVVIYRTDSSADRSIPVNPGFGDTIADNFFQIYAGPGGFRFSYFGTTWYPEPIIGHVGVGFSPRVATAPLTGTLVVRDGSGIAQFADPVGSSDAATKGYVDNQDTARQASATGVAAAMALVFGG